jgi:lactate dehydrogenase-like 2-hydroxyacid dehydrogenase
MPPVHDKPHFRTASRSSLITKDYDPEDVLKEHFASLNLENSVLPIAFTDGATEEDQFDLTSSTTQSRNAPKHKKVSIVGCGQVGMAIAYSILNQEIAGSIALVDIDAEKLDGEAKDLQQGSAFHQRVRIEASSDYSITAGSHLVIITAGVAQKVGESRLSLVERNGKLVTSEGEDTVLFLSH